MPAPLDAASLGSGAAGSKASSAEKRAASEVARTGLLRLAVRTPFTLHEVDIHSNADLERRWLFEIPVIEVDGRVVTQAPVDLEAVRRVLEAR